MIAIDNEIYDDEHVVDEFITNIIIEDLLNEELFVESIIVSKTLKRKRFLRNKDLWLTEWGKLIKHVNVSDVSSFEGKKFRRRFRVPYDLFINYLVPECNKVNLFDTIRKSYIPLEFKILLCLRILGRDDCHDAIQELTGIGESTSLYLFNKFVSNFVKHFYNLYVKPPNDLYRQQVMNLYSKLGLPGAIGSMDCTHIKWNMCPDSDRHLCIGKEGFPTLSFEVVVDHFRLIHHVSKGFYGKTNDKKVVINDNYPFEILHGKYKDISYYLYDKNGVPILCKGAYLIVDGGYLKVACMIDPDKHACSRDALLFSEWIESVRKDVECVFGILKQRFRILRNGITYHDPLQLELIFKTCCILHNMILCYDIGDITTWEKNINWDKIDPDLNDTEANFLEDKETDEQNDNDITEMLQADSIQTLLQKNSITSTTNIKTYFPKSSNHYTALKDDLLVSFAHQYKIGKLFWPKHMNHKNKSSIKLITNDITNRINTDAYLALYIKQSDLKSMNTNSSIGKGLFSSISYKKDDFIVKFNGEIISMDEYQIKVLNGKGGYALKINQNQVLDCYESFLNGKCKASAANDCKNCYNSKTNCGSLNNARISFDTKNYVFKLIATKDIQCHDEILWNYGGEYL